MSAIPEEIDDNDWAEAFNYAAPQRGFGETCKVTDVVREDVKRVISCHEGANDGESWLLVAELHDGRFMLLSAWCDYTGWGCRAGGHCFVASTLENLMRYGATDEERDRIGIVELGGP